MPATQAEGVAINEDSIRSILESAKQQGACGQILSALEAQLRTALCEYQKRMREAQELSKTVKTVQGCAWKVSAAAEALNVNRVTVYRRLQRAKKLRGFVDDATN